MPRRNPLRKGYSAATVTANIGQLRREGRAGPQAVAMAHEAARRAYRARFPRARLPRHLTPARSPLRSNPDGRARLDKEYARAADLYQRFSGHEAGPLAQVAAPVVPKVAIVIGYCDGILYSTVRDGKAEKYIHEFARRDRPLFLVSPDGKQLLLYGGGFDFTERGIVDRSTKDG